MTAPRGDPNRDASIRQAAPHGDFEVGHTGFEAPTWAFIQILCQITKTHMGASFDFIEIGRNIFQRLLKAPQIGKMKFCSAHRLPHAKTRRGIESQWSGRARHAVEAEAGPAKGRTFDLDMSLPKPLAQ